MTLRDFFNVIYKRINLLIISMIVVLIAVAVFVTVGISPRYQANSTLIVTSQEDTSAQIVTLQEVTQSSILLDLVHQKLQTTPSYRTSTDELIKRTQMSVKSGSPIVTISYQDTNAKKARYVDELISKTLVDKAVKYTSDISISIASASKVDSKPIFPNLKSSLVMGTGVGFVLGLILIFISEFFSSKVKSEIYSRVFLELDTLGKIEKIH
ncbi:hypothetical protein CJP55_04040 [Lactobacillus plantarum]|nr:hypothetical protein [Lactiplantibacillus plantarum]